MKPRGGPTSKWRKILSLDNHSPVFQCCLRTLDSTNTQAQSKFNLKTSVKRKLFQEFCWRLVNSLVIGLTQIADLPAFGGWVNNFGFGTNFAPQLAFTTLKTNVPDAHIGHANEAHDNHKMNLISSMMWLMNSDKRTEERRDVLFRRFFVLTSQFRSEGGHWRVEKGEKRRMKGVVLLVFGTYCHSVHRPHVTLIAHSKNFVWIDFSYLCFIRGFLF